MEEVKNGDSVKVHYKGTLADGTVFDSSEGRDPLSFKVGENQVIPGFEQAVVGMKVGDSRTETIAADNAYGAKREELLIKAPREHMPEGLEPEVGQQLQMTTREGRPVPVTIIEVGEAEVTLDANHPLAGKDLTFEITLVEIAS